MFHFVNLVMFYFVAGICLIFTSCTQKYTSGSISDISFSDIQEEFKNPPDEARPWIFWWWLDGNASKEGITRDFEEMKRQGIGGALLFDAGDGGPAVPQGPAFMGDQWRELFKHAVREADRFGIVLTANLCSGWNAGGPWVTPEHATKILVQSPPVIVITSRQINVQLPDIDSTEEDIVILALPLEGDTVPSKLERCRMVDVTHYINKNRKLVFDTPTDKSTEAWCILRIGSKLKGHKTVAVGSGPIGLEIDPMSAEAMDLHFAETGAKMIADAGALAGKTFQYVHIDSWEIGQPTWTPKMREEFRKRRGYDPLLWLPAIAGNVVDNDNETEQFMRDFRLTVADLVAENYYGRLNKLAIRGGLKGAHSEAGGPVGAHGFWGDGLRNIGVNAIPMGEFWQRNTEPDGSIFYGPYNHTIRQAASAAHIYGLPISQAEAFTTLSDDWSQAPWDMKDLGDAAFCDGLTRNVLCFWVHQPQLNEKPGIGWNHIGTHFDRNLTWWPMANGWLSYLARCQHMLRQGLFVADFAYLQKENIPSFVARKIDQQPMRPRGFDYDAINADALLKRANAENGRLILPDGMSYRYLVLPHQDEDYLSPATLKKVNELAEAGVAIIGPTRFAGAISKMQQGALADIVKMDALLPDIEFHNSSEGAEFDWIHRHNRGMDIYFISNQGIIDATTHVRFRVSGKQPELWDAVTGKIRDLPEHRKMEDGRMEVPINFAPRQSWFVVFRREAANPKTTRNFPELKPIRELSGPWEVQFDKEWFYGRTPMNASVVFQKLEDWTKRSEDAIKYYSGIATYTKAFNFSEYNMNHTTFSIDLGEVKNVARVRLNGQDLGILWTAPWIVEVPMGLLKATDNKLEIEVANLWPNRLIGDGLLPKEQRRTKTNVCTYDTPLPRELVPTSMWARSYCLQCKERLKTGKSAKLLSSGLLGPVRLMAKKCETR